MKVFNVDTETVATTLVISAKIKKILETQYTSGIAKITSYGRAISGNIVGEFLADGSRFYYSINPTQNTVSYNPVGLKNISDLAGRNEEERVDAKIKVGAKTRVNKAGKTLICTPGKTYPCGAVCRAMNKPCKQPMNPEAEKIVKEISIPVITTGKNLQEKKEANKLARIEANKKNTKAADWAAVNKLPQNNQVDRPEEKEFKSTFVEETLGKNAKYGDSGKLIYLPLDSIKSTTPSNASQKEINDAAESLKGAGGRNAIPFIVTETADYEYEVMGNQFIYEACKKAGLSHAWCIILPEGYKKSVQLLSREVEGKSTATISNSFMPAAPKSEATPNINSSQSIKELAKQLEGGKLNITPVYVRRIKALQEKALTSKTEEKGSIFKLKEFENEIPIGQTFRGVTSFVKNAEDKPDPKYEYEVVENGHILEASRLAKNDFIKIMLIDPQMEKQLKAEKINAR